MDDGYNMVYRNIYPKIIFYHCTSGENKFLKNMDGQLQLSCIVIQLIALYKF